MERVDVFISEEGQLIPLPEIVALQESVKQVDIIPLGRARLIMPAGEAWDIWFSGEGVSDDFMNEREQPD